MSNSYIGRRVVSNEPATEGIRVKFYITTLNVKRLRTPRQANAVAVKPYIQVGKFECTSIVRYNNNVGGFFAPDRAD